MRWWNSSEAFGGLLLLLLGLIVFAVMKGCASVGAPDGYRYRLTVYTGSQAYSTVSDVRYSSDYSLEGFKSQHVYMGDREAIPIVRPGRSLTFALPAYEVPPEQVAAELARRRQGLPADQRDGLTVLRDEQELPRQLFSREISDSPYHRDDVVRAWPVFVTFTDPSDPATRREVSPESVGVTRVTVQLTQEPASRRIFREFPKLIRAVSGQQPATLQR